ARAWMGTPGYEELDQELELERVVEACDQVVALVVRRFRWKSDGSLADEHRMGHLYRIRDGLIVRWQPFLDPADALRAAGIDENDAAV
ncbi:MAG TPA: hypothetical protein VGS17_07970, partial [Candidatus Limnocylindria bacterium]|nr:hypothetical protein [Candidatus Limnocylindria bacterium]